MNSVPFHLCISGSVETELDSTLATERLLGNLDAAVSALTGEGMITAFDDMELECFSSLVNAGPNAAYEGFREAATRIRLEGYAVVVFSPEELGGVDPRTLQNRLVELGNQAIDDLKE
jgi:hypothetical protein